MKIEPVVVEKLYESPVNKIWKALVDNEELKQWYFKLDEFKAIPGFKFSFYGGEEGGEQFKHLCEIRKVVENKKLAYSWQYEGKPGISIVTWELLPEGRKTKLTITHEGLESFASSGPAFARHNFVEGWTYFLEDALNKFLNTKS